MDCGLIIGRLKQYLGVKSDSALSRVLGLKQATISAWKTRNSMDYGLVIEKVEGIDLNWLFRGEEQRQNVEVTAGADEGQASFYKEAYERKCREYDAANRRIDILIDKIK